jgi:hypothetical protein
MPHFDSWATSSGAAIDRIADLLQKTSRQHGDGLVEAFHRSSSSRRVEWDSASKKTRSRVGREQGGALRWIDPRREVLGFAASSGTARVAFETCLSIAAETPEKPVIGCPWNLEATAAEDLDALAGLPRLHEMEEWLRKSTPQSAESAWVETGLSTENWLSSPQNVQKRVRGRVWAMWIPRKTHGMGSKPLFVSARGWHELLRLDPLEAWADRSSGQPRETPWPDDAKLVFSPETSASLAWMLALVTHHPEIRPGATVGPGWVLTARPQDDPGSLFGSAMDDAGFPSESRVLADGRHVTGDWGGPGSLRRGSFRDIPEPTPVSLRITPPRLDPPKRSVWVTRIDLHPADDHWMAELHGRQYPDGAAFQNRWARLEPQRLVEACLGGIGPARRSHLGMTTPALVFDAWLLKGD